MPETSHSTSENHGSEAKYPESILLNQRYLLHKVNKNIIVNIPPEGTSLEAFNIREADFVNLKFMTSKQDYKEDPVGLISVEVFLVQNGVLSQFPVEITGLTEIVRKQMQDADSEAFINGTTTYTPFLGGIGLGGDPVGTVVDNLSRYSLYSPDTHNIEKVYKLRLFGRRCYDRTWFGFCRSWGK